MLKREDELRLSTEVQSRFADPSFDAIRIAAEVQEQVVTEFGYGESAEMHKLGLDIIRSAPSLYPDDPVIRKIPHYLKYNRSRRGELEPGDVIPDAYLAQLSGAPVTLFDCLSSLSCSSMNRVVDINIKQASTNTVVIACGSYT